MNQTIGKKIKFYREQSNISLSELAAVLEKPASEINDYEMGKVMPDIDTIRSISHILNLSTDELLVFTKEK